MLGLKMASGGDVAGDYGFEDALEGNDMRGSVYFVGSDLALYNHAYGQGLVARRGLQVDLAIVDAGVIPADSEFVFMSKVLASLRANKSACPVCGIWIDKHGRCGCNTRHEDPLSNGERIGEHFCTRPFEY